MQLQSIYSKDSSSNVYPFQNDLQTISQKIDQIQSQLVQFIIINPKLHKINAQNQFSSSQSHHTINNKLTQQILNFQQYLQINGFNQESSIKYIDRSLYYMNFSWNSLSCFAKCFQINSKKRKVTRNNNQRGNMRQIIASKPFTNKQQIIVTLRINSYGNQKQFIYFGLITKNRLKNMWNHGGQNQSIGYRTCLKYQQGGIWIDGLNVHNRDSNLFLKPGEDITIMMKRDNKKQYKIEFSNKNISVNSLCFNLQRQHWKQQDIYLYVTMIDENASVSVID